MAKFQLPDALKAAVPQNMWGRILAATPVVMTVIATALAGLASSEMTRAQYGRSLGAQQQSKAGDQWNFFQAKRLRSALQKNALDILQGTTDLHPFTAPNLDPQTLAALTKGELPPMPPAPVLDPSIKTALVAVENQKPDEETAKLLMQVKDKTLAEAVQAAQDRAQAFDKATSPINQVIDQLDKSLTSGEKTISRDFTAARLRYTAARYDAEARLNQAIANLYELQVRRSNTEAERHHRRSQQFFFGMLTAQAAVIISTFSLAAQKRSLLWSLAAAAGAAAIAFAVYVYLFV
ncbi:MAG TPA: hypothetical protein VL171_08180 [Verrucomicrobiae bacterium]|nr:hypothetical protein [Verrucomicrobiae bacterium]